MARPCNWYDWPVIAQINQILLEFTYYHTIFLFWLFNSFNLQALILFIHPFHPCFVRIKYRCGRMDKVICFFNIWRSNILFVCNIPLLNLWYYFFINILRRKILSLCFLRKMMKKKSWRIYLYKTEEKKKGYVCKICGYVYEGEQLPEDFICPLCKHPASDFEPLE